MFDGDPLTKPYRIQEHPFYPALLVLALQDVRIVVPIRTNKVASLVRGGGLVDVRSHLGLMIAERCEPKELAVPDGFRSSGPNAFRHGKCF